MSLDRDMQYVKGVGPARAESLKKLGIFTLRDALDFFPRRYVDLSQPVPIRDLADGEVQVVSARIVSEVRTVRTRTNLLITTFDIDDGTATMGIRLFNQEFAARTLSVGERYLFYGKVAAAGFFKEMNAPAIEQEKNRAILPVYPSCAGLSQKMMRKLIGAAVDGAQNEIEETLPDRLCDKYELMGLADAYREVHHPTCDASLQKAKDRFVFEELLQFCLGLNVLRSGRVKKQGIRLAKIDCKEFFDALPYALTGAQMRAARECIKDMMSGTPMARLVQGDVGCGKTAVASLLMYYTARAGYQSCLMAPTEILAHQHYESLSVLFGRFGISCALLTGSSSAATKKEILKQLYDGRLQVLIGTHAVISDKVAFHNLALCVTDEQHRFGVGQRAKLSEKGIRPHVLVMSATPIPRTLSLILYGDLDVSVIDELPPGRKPVSTHLVDSSYHDRMYGFVASTVAQGGQAYVVCPLVEEGDDEELKSVQAYTDELAHTVLASCRVGYVHGKMAPKEKNAVLEAFASGNLDVLVSTTVIEVGINVPKATVMIIENAERFGLAQLHQLRGRVGRGSDKSYCFVRGDVKSEKTRERLSAFCSTSDGFEISRLDLKQRGPGDFFGARQSGLPLFAHADLMRDMSVLETAKGAAEDILNDPTWFEDARLVGLRDGLVRLFKRYDFRILS